MAPQKMTVHFRARQSAQANKHGSVASISPNIQYLPKARLTLLTIHEIFMRIYGCVEDLPDSLGGAPFRHRIFLK